MKNEQKSYTDMNTQEKAQAIYRYMVNEQREALENLLLDLSVNTTEPIMKVEEWVDDFREFGNLYDLIQIAQQSKELDLDDEYIRTNLYYYGYATSDNVINLVDEDEAVDWIANALDDRYAAIDSLEDIDKVMRIKFN